MTARALPARPARFLLGAGSTALALALGAAPFVLTASAHAAASDEPKYSICHATGAADNPYVTPPPAEASKILSGHGDHLGPVYAPGMKDDGIVWGDIIPAFDYVDGDGVTQHYPGLNWGTDGQAIYNNGCALPSTGGTTGGETTGETTGATTGQTTGATTGQTTGATTGQTTGATTGQTTGATTGATTGETTGETTGATTGETTTGGSTGGTTGVITGGGTGATVTPVVTTPKPAHKPVTGGGGAVTAAKTLPFTGDRTSSLALWGFASLLGGIGFTALGGRKAQRVR